MKKILSAGLIGACLLFQTLPFDALAFEPPTTAAELQQMLEAERMRAERIRLERERLDAERAAIERAMRNFTVTAPTREIERQVHEAAARRWAESRLCNNTLAVPCPITVRAGQMGAGGATTFSFAGGEVFGWRMNVQGTLERILDSVIPHEVCHILNACDTRRPLPRWLDEGIATLEEADSERARQLALARQIVGTARFIPVRELLSIKEYPRDMQAVLALYAEGSMLTEFLVHRAAAAAGETWTTEQARQWMLDFGNYAHTNGWDAALVRYRDDIGGLSNVDALAREYERWLRGRDTATYVFAPPVVTPPLPAGQQGGILPVRNTDPNRNVVPLGR